jgi:DME family drug/metabolite transporter
MTYRTGVALVVLAGFLWSGIGLGIRLIGDASAWQILFWRSLGAAPALFLLLALRTGSHPLQAIRRQGVAGLVGGVALVFASPAASMPTRPPQSPTPPSCSRCRRW